MTHVFVTEQDQAVVYEDGEHSLRENFDRFHERNPHVYDELVKLAREWQRRRASGKCGIGMLYEVCRWHLSLRTEGEPLALNNNYRAFYARLIMEEPGLAGIFETRRQRAVEEPEAEPDPMEGEPHLFDPEKFA